MKENRQKRIFLLVILLIIIVAIGVVVYYNFFYEQPITLDDTSVEKNDGNSNDMERFMTPSAKPIIYIQKKKQNFL